ncbi:lipase family protein [Shimazuella sp. AN120528]|uniref:esterase/lipase family protein n=1 Tax=Shimazuella soli TaxID=1892854 RepID=UPI001F10210E|nr:alpha/beta fold hydrolase [Shimazuella soli]MCH5586439.1 lipase family protein [Shimazuella soli]
MQMKAYRIIFSFLASACLMLISNTAFAETNSSTAFLSEEGPAPIGANNPSCHPDEKHPYPVILVPGTFETMQANWAALAPWLAARGYCVYTLNYGLGNLGPSTGPIEKSADELKIFVDNVLKLTGSKKVSLVGHSQGGMMARYYIKFLGGQDKVDDLIGLVPSNHGTNGIANLQLLTSTVADLTNCDACKQQLIGSDFLQKLNQGDETPGTVSYTSIGTRTDEVVVPYTSAFLTGPSERVVNITLQNYYPLDLIEHQFIPFDLNTFNFILDALSHDGPANPERAVK